MPENLRPEGTRVVVGSPAGDVVLYTPGLRGVAEVHAAATPGMRAAEATTEEFVAALSGAGVSEQLTVEITDQTELDSQGGTRASGGGNEIVVDVPAPGEGNGQVLLYAAEDGSVTWHYPDSVAPDEVGQRGGERRTYRLPRAVVPGEATEGSTRGLLGAVGSKLFKVLVFPLIEPALGRAANHFAGRWEAEHRPPMLRAFGSVGRADAAAAPFGSDDWVRLGEGVALMFVHGTFSTADGGFGALPDTTLAELHRRYGGRVFAFEHPSVSVTPRANVRWLAEQLPGDGAPGGLTVDVVTHSRGGLVGRALAERGSELGLDGRLTVRNLVMVAPPNAGTALAHKENISALLDRFTNLLQFVPSAGITDAIGMVVSVVKQVAVGAFGGLEGIMSMNPAGPDLTDFNHSPGSTATYRVIAANFTPPPGSSLGRIARDKGTDLVFGGVANDLVVPTEGGYDVPSTAGFPVADPLVLPPERAVDHSSFFGRDDVNAKLLEWLPG